MRTKILIIEDDKILRENIAELLSLSGYDTTTAEGGRQGIQQAKSEKPDLIVCDIMMPDTDGFSVLYALQNQGISNTIPFIFLTAKTDNEAYRQGMNLGADDFLHKPFDDIELLNAIEVRLNKHQTRADSTNQTGKEQIADAKPSANKQNSSLADVMEDLLSEAFSIQLDAGDNLYYQDDKPSFVYFVEWGSIKTYKMNRDGKAYITEVYYEHELMGYKPVIENRSYKQFAEASVKSSVRKIPAGRFKKAIFNEPGLAEHFIRHMSKRLSDKEAELMSIAYNSVARRIGDKLLMISEKHPENLIDISRSELAEMVGTTPETMARTISQFDDDGLIDTEGRSISIPDYKKFKKALERL
ncbi:MAG: response regulator [Bacteroidota bacterium]